MTGYSTNADVGDCVTGDIKNCCSIASPLCFTAALLVEVMSPAFGCTWAVAATVGYCDCGAFDSVVGRTVCDTVADSAEFEVGCDTAEDTVWGILECGGGTGWDRVDCSGGILYGIAGCDTVCDTAGNEEDTVCAIVSSGERVCCATLECGGGMEYGIASGDVDTELGTAGSEEGIVCAIVNSGEITDCEKADCGKDAALDCNEDVGWN